MISLLRGGFFLALATLAPQSALSQEVTDDSEAIVHEVRLGIEQNGAHMPAVSVFKARTPTV
tara:strand:+ start:4400 stop:4585 length:186 start_codon:yes stop_codon:yes gene_type:complete